MKIKSEDGVGQIYVRGIPIADGVHTLLVLTGKTAVFHEQSKTFRVAARNGWYYTVDNPHSWDSWVEAIRAVMDGESRDGP